MVEKKPLCAPDSFFSVLAQKERTRRARWKKEKGALSLMRSFATPSADNFASGSRRCPGGKPTFPTRRAASTVLPPMGTSAAAKAAPPFGLPPGGKLSAKRTDEGNRSRRIRKVRPLTSPVCALVCPLLEGEEQETEVLAAITAAGGASPSPTLHAGGNSSPSGMPGNSDPHRPVFSRRPLVGERELCYNYSVILDLHFDFPKGNRYEQQGF